MEQQNVNEVEDGYVKILKSSFDLSLTFNDKVYFFTNCMASTFTLYNLDDIIEELMKDMG